MDYLKTEEKLIQSQIDIISALKTRESLKAEKIICSVKSAESLSASTKFTLPLKVKGHMLGVGKHKVKYYIKEELIKAAERFNSGKSRVFKIMLDHDNHKMSAVIGKVDEVIWNEELQCLDYLGHINDETHARNILDGSENQVSVTSYSNNVFNPGLNETVATDIEFDELSSVEEGAYTGNSITAVV